MKSVTFDPIWEEKYRSGQKELYPWDCVVTFLFRNYPRDKARQDIKVLEVGCGTGSNIWFVAREGFSASGVDGSASAIEKAQKRLDEEGLKADLRVGDFTKLPFEDESFDIVIDRGSITCCGLSAGQKAVQEVHRVLKSGGSFFANPYSQRHSSYVAGERIDDGLTVNIKEGTMTGVGQICFYSRADVDKLFSSGFAIKSLQHVEVAEESQAASTRHCEWRITAVKI